MPSFLPSASLILRRGVVSPIFVGQQQCQIQPPGLARTDDVAAHALPTRRRLQLLMDS
jgi:hypothetical protein